MTDSAVVCPACGARNAPGTTRCDLCGEPLTEEARADAPADPAEPTPAPPVEAAPVVADPPAQEAGPVPEAAERQFCMACGAENPLFARFCWRCGAALYVTSAEGPGPRDPAAPAVQAGPPADAPGAPPPAPPPAAVLRPP
ncbi:MAG: zinc ribbon domain-containing protein, partial [Rhodothermales bacterium]|nr:zinc ribbon domain-containing protein [Rhodothermales bacterium]